MIYFSCNLPQCSKSLFLQIQFTDSFRLGFLNCFCKGINFRLQLPYFLKYPGKSVCAFFQSCEFHYAVDIELIALPSVYQISQHFPCFPELHNRFVHFHLESNDFSSTSEAFQNIKPLNETIYCIFIQIIGSDG